MCGAAEGAEAEYAAYFASPEHLCTLGDRRQGAIQRMAPAGEPVLAGDRSPSWRGDGGDNLEAMNGKVGRWNSDPPLSLLSEGPPSVTFPREGVASASFSTTRLPDDSHGTSPMNEADDFGGHADTTRSMQWTPAGEYTHAQLALWFNGSHRQCQRAEGQQHRTTQEQMRMSNFLVEE